MLSTEYQSACVEAFKDADYQEIFGLNFSTDPTSWTKAHQNVLQKFFTANEGKVSAAKEQLTKTLKWRKSYNPLEASQESHDTKFTKLGVITKSPTDRIITWNLYGAIKDPGELFAKTDEFIRWRVGLHERALSLLKFEDPDLDRMDQVHDYMNVSFLRMDSRIKKTSSKIIEMFQDYYPETLNAKYFVNVPYIMMWVFKLVTSLSSSATASKFCVLANGSQLAGQIGDWCPQAYGGKGPTLQDMECVKNDIQREEVD